MTTDMIGSLAAIAVLTIWLVAGYISLRMACRGVKPSPDWFEGWSE